MAAPSVFGDVERSQPINSTIVVAVQVAFDNPVGPGSSSNNNRRRSIVTREHRLQPRQVVSNVRATEANAQFVVEAAESVAKEALDSANVGEKNETNDIELELGDDYDSASVLRFPALVAFFGVVLHM